MDISIIASSGKVYRKTELYITKTSVSIVYEGLRPEIKTDSNKFLASWQMVHSMSELIRSLSHPIIAPNMRSWITRRTHSR